MDKDYEVYIERLSKSDKNRCRKLLNKIQPMKIKHAEFVDIEFKFRLTDRAKSDLAFAKMEELCIESSRYINELELITGKMYYFAYTT